ncbi:hypothetical protein D9M72_557800 [compost metagenome]
MDFHRFADRDHRYRRIAGARTGAHVHIGSGKAFGSLGDNRGREERTDRRCAQDKFLHSSISPMERPLFIWPPNVGGRPEPLTVAAITPDRMWIFYG